MPFWLLVLPPIVLIANLIWLWVAQNRGWDQGDSETPQRDPDRGELSQDKHTSAIENGGNWRNGVRKHLWGITLIAVLAALLLFTIIFAPPRLGGEIPIIPNKAGRPFYSLHWLRDFQREHYDEIWMANVAIGSALSILVLGIAQFRRWYLAGEVNLLLISTTLGVSAQWLLNGDIQTPDVLTYGLAAAGFCFWALTARERLLQDLAARPKLDPRWEWLLVIGLIGLAAFARFYALPRVPYGVEGDESKWIHEVVQLMVDGQPNSSGEYHRDALPLSFYMQIPFQRIMGVGIYSARVGVVIYSLLATLAFYWLMRQIAPLPLAGLATFFLSISIMDISASRLANVESHVKLWPILALALLALGVRISRWEVYALSGIALSFGLLTYETIWPVAGVALLLAIAELLSQRSPTRAIVRRLAALTFFPLLALPLLVPYFVSRLDYYKIGEKGWRASIWTTLSENLRSVLHTWFVQVRPDFLYNRSGPFLNAILLPWLVLGLVIAIFTWRRKVSRWALVWMVLVLLPVPILANSPFGRVYYPGLPAVYALIALGVYVFGREIFRLLGPVLRPIGVILALAVLVWLPLFNLYIYYNEVGDPADRLKRREIGKMASLGVNDQTHLYIPYSPGANDPLFVEKQIVELYLHQNLSVSKIPQVVEYIPYDAFLPDLTANRDSWKEVKILLDKESSSLRDLRDSIRRGLTSCFPGGRLWKGEYFDRYSLDIESLSQPACLPVQLAISVPEGSISAEDPLPFHWSLSAGNAAGLSLICDQGREDVNWVEGEDFTLGSGWRSDVAFVEDWKGSGYLVDTYNAQFASREVNLPQADQAYVWVRFYKREVDQSPAFLHLNQQSLTFADVSEDELDRWIWERVGPFESPGGVKEWRITRPFNEDQNQFMALFIDAVVFTTDPEFSPQDNSLWQSVKTNQYAFSRPIAEGVVEMSLSAGRYLCTAEVESDLPLVDAFGVQPVRSNEVNIEIP